MENQEFKVGYTIVCVLVYGSFLLSLLGASAYIAHWPISDLFLMVGGVLFVPNWIIILSDVVKRPIYNRRFWLLSMFILPTIAPLVYLIQRNKMMRFIDK